MHTCKICVYLQKTPKYITTYTSDLDTLTLEFLQVGNLQIIII